MIHVVTVSLNFVFNGLHWLLETNDTWIADNLPGFIH